MDAGNSGGVEQSGTPQGQVTLGNEGVPDIDEEGMDTDNQFSDDDTLSDCGYSSADSVVSLEALPTPNLSLRPSTERLKGYVGRRRLRLRERMRQLVDLADVSNTDIPLSDPSINTLGSPEGSVLSQIFHNRHLMMTWSRFIAMPEGDQRTLLAWCSAEEKRKRRVAGLVRQSSLPGSMNPKTFKLLIQMILKDKLESVAVEQCENSVRTFFDVYKRDDNVAFSLKVHSFPKQVTFMAVCQYYDLRYKTLGANDEKYAILLEGQGMIPPRKRTLTDLVYQRLEREACKEKRDRIKPNFDQMCAVQRAFRNLNLNRGHSSGIWQV